MWDEVRCGSVSRLFLLFRRTYCVSGEHLLATSAATAVTLTVTLTVALAMALTVLAVAPSCLYHLRLLLLYHIRLLLRRAY